jgi:hypothetical protein
LARNPIRKQLDKPLSGLSAVRATRNRTEDDGNGHERAGFEKIQGQKPNKSTSNDDEFLKNLAQNFLE